MINKGQYTVTGVTNLRLAPRDLAGHSYPKGYKCLRCYSTMHYHIILTTECNLTCRYCYGKSVRDSGSCSDEPFTYDFSAPSRSEVDVHSLKAFLERDENPVLIFYGGEPLLEIEKMKEIIDAIDIPFRIQTNGTLLDRLSRTYLNRIGKILISLDGGKERTDSNRGKGTYNRIMKNVTRIKDGYKGELIARMTIAQDYPDIYEQVVSLLEDGFSSVHWQLDAGFYRFDFDEEKFRAFVDGYNKGISALLDYWVQQMEKGRIIMLYPFVGIVSSLLAREKTSLRCGAGHRGYCITTNGKVVACPIASHVTDFAAGTLKADPSQLKQYDVAGRCLSCALEDVCGGRCLYWNKAHLWPEEGDDLICRTVNHLIAELKRKFPAIEELIQKGVIQREGFEYEKYFGPEIIP